MEVLVRDAHEGAEEPGTPGDLPDPAEDDLQEFLLGDAEAAVLVLADVEVVALAEPPGPGTSLHVTATFPARDETLEEVHVLLRVGAVVAGAQVLAEEELDLVERLLRDDRRPVRVHDPVALALGEFRLVEVSLLLVYLLLRDVRGVAEEPPHARVPEPLRRMSLTATGRVALRPEAPVVEGRDGFQDRAGLKVRLERRSRSEERR